jgi:hypothetical protein
MSAEAIPFVPTFIINDDKFLNEKEVVEEPTVPDINNSTNSTESDEPPPPVPEPEISDEEQDEKA